MATQKRSNNSAFSQPDRLIVRVALYARVSTLNNQDPFDAARAEEQGDINEDFPT